MGAAFLVLAVLVFVVVEHEAIVDAVFQVACTAVYVECGQQTDLLVKIINILIGLVTIGVIVFLIGEGVKEFVQSEFGGNKMEKRASKMKNHFILCGYGALGRTVVQALKREKVEFVVIDRDSKVIAQLESNGVTALVGEALESDVLEKAGIKQAKMLISALGSDSDNVFLSLTAKELNPKIRVATRAFTESAVLKLHGAGADIIVLPEVIGGLELAKEALGLTNVEVKRLIRREGDE